MSWLERAQNTLPTDLPYVSTVPGLPNLRDAQRQAFALIAHPVGFLWGPPGTGKTFTVGAMLANYLLRVPEPKVLLLSTTNSAVDEALISVDRALDILAQSDDRAVAIKQKCKRIGSHFIASKYEAEGRRHLLPAQDPALISRLAELETQRPDPGDLNRYHEWKTKVDELRKLIPRSIRDSALVAMTTTGAAFFFDSLRDEAPFDIVLFDEASQVSLAYALALAPLGRSTIFAGDPKQLAPIAKTKEPYLVRSIFDEIKNRTECLLNEQGRMAQPICEVVSKLFYKGQLIVAKDCGNNREWLKKRWLHPVPPMGQQHVYLYECDGSYDPTNGKTGVRAASADFIVNVVKNLLDELDASDILVLTPYRRQRMYIRSKLRAEGITKVLVTTVHRAQGGECHTVIFDPVVGNDSFLTSEDVGQRLINVAFSRAQARLVVVASRRDLQNKWLRQLKQTTTSGHQIEITATPVCDIAFKNNFPSAWIGKMINCHGVVGTITSVHSGGFTLADAKTDEERHFRLKLVKELCEKQSARVNRQITEPGNAGVDGVIHR